MSWYLEFSHPESGSQKLELKENSPLKIGRGSASDTKIPDPALSRVHCELLLQEGQPVLTDLGSSVGTFVENDRIENRKLASGQTFQAGNTQFKIFSDSQLDAPTVHVGSTPAHPDTDALATDLAEAGSIDRYPLTELVNQGGRNLVYRCGARESDSVVAVKVLPTAESSDEGEARFLRAMKMLQEIRDPSLVKLYRAGRKSRFCWVAMEWFDAGSIADRIKRHGIDGRLDWRDAWRVAYSISRSLEVLERQNIVHRNIRPTNILYRDSDDSWVLSDLVVAKAEDTDGKNMVTQQVFLPSNLAYVAPERLLGSEANTHSLQSDIYSLGAVLTEMLTGEPPFGSGELRDLLPRLRDKPQVVTAQSQLGINELLVDLVNRIANPDPTKRFATADALWQEVKRVGKLTGMKVG